MLCLLPDMLNFAPLQIKTYKLVAQMFVRQGKKMAVWGVPIGFFGELKCPFDIRNVLTMLRILYLGGWLAWPAVPDSAKTF